MFSLSGTKTKDLVVQTFVEEHPLTVRKLFYILKNKHRKSLTENNVRKVVYDLYNNKVLAKKGNEYYLSIDFLEQLKLLSEKVRESYLRRSMFDASLKAKINKLAKRKQLQHCETCNDSLPEGFCLLCMDMVCKGCGELVRIHNHNCNIKHECRYCNRNKDMGNCAVCFGECCNNCSKEVWVHHPEQCSALKKVPDKNVVIGMLEVDHQCWFSNLSEKTDCSPELTTFIDDLDRKYKTHSGRLLVEMEKDQRRKLIERIYKSKQIINVKPVFIDKKRMLLRTRALFDKSFEESTHKNDSVILNPVIATDTKEKNIVIAPNIAGLRKVAKSFKEQGKCKIASYKQVSLGKLNQFDFKSMFGKFFEYIDQKDLTDAIRKFQLMYRINDLFGGIRQ